MDIKVLGIDFGKTVSSLAGLDDTGAVVFRKRLQRHRLLDSLATLPPCVVAMEACGGSHHIRRFCLSVRTLKTIRRNISSTAAGRGA